MYDTPVVLFNWPSAHFSQSFMIPFFFFDAFTDYRGQNANAISSTTANANNANALTLGMVASVVANVSGLMTGGLYLFLKSSTLATIAPKDKVGEYENRKATYKITRYESSELDDPAELDGRMMHPVAASRTLRRMDSEASLISMEKDEEAYDAKSIKSNRTKNGRRSPDSVRSNKFVSVVASALMPKAPEPARIPPTPAAGSHVRKRSYSLFPRNPVASKASVVLLPSTTYSPASALKPPPSMANLANMRHRRDSSLVSMATVQIGIRLSSVDDMPPLAQTKMATSDDKVVHTLDCPNVVKESTLQSPKRAGAMASSTDTSALSSGARDASPTRAPAKEAKMKVLPVVPKINSQVPKVEPAQDGFTLSPAVYSPNTPTKVKLPSPRGVGFTMPAPKTASSSSPPRSPPRRRGTGDTTPPATDAKDWI